MEITLFLPGIPSGALELVQFLQLWAKLLALQASSSQDQTSTGGRDSTKDSTFAKPAGTWLVLQLRCEVGRPLISVGLLEVRFESGGGATIESSSGMSGAEMLESRALGFAEAKV